MAVHLCGICGQVRARSGEDICPVCWLVDELKREHDAGDHTAINSSCVDCTRTLTKKQFRNLVRPESYQKAIDKSRAQTKAEKKSVPRKMRAERIDHSQCGHPMTPPARAICRAKKSTG